MLNLEVSTDKAEEVAVVSEGEEAAENMRRLLGTDDVEHNQAPVEEVPAYEPLAQGEVRFTHQSGQNISTILANGTHVEFPLVSDDKGLIEELTAWSVHVGCMTVTTYEDEQAQAAQE